MNEPSRPPIVVDIAKLSRPRWWVRAMSWLADILWEYHLTAASWSIADLCLWLQRKILKREKSK